MLTVGEGPANQRTSEGEGKRGLARASEGHVWVMARTRPPGFCVLTS